jgi:outer membrane protein OmpA-like peptidoglycan-associated protein
MKTSIKLIAAATLLQVGVAQAQSNQPQLKSYSIGARATHLYDVSSKRFDSELSRDLKGLNGDKTSFDMGFDVYVEKQFTPIWGVQVGYRNGRLTGANNQEYYKSTFSACYGDLLFNISNLDKRHMQSRFNYYAKAGLGFGAFAADRFLVADDSPNGGIEDSYWETRLGAGLQYEINTYLRLELDIAYNIAFNDGFDGYNSSTGSDPYLSTGLGIAYTFGKKESKPMYAVNFFGEEYFGTPQPAETTDNKADSLLAIQLEQAQARMSTMEDVIEEQKAAIARLQAEKAQMQEVKVQGQEAVYFSLNSSTLSESAKRELMKTLTGEEEGVTLTGFVDNTGDAAYNEKLKAKRVEAVKQFLVEVIGFEESAISMKLAEDIKDLKNNDFLNRKVVVTYYR